MSSNTTVVTMYFNLRSLEDVTDEVRSKTFYIEKGRATLTLNAPMVIFCDETCYQDIKMIREEYFKDMTTYVVKPLTEYDFYKHSYPVIRKNRQGDEMYRNSRNTSSCFILYMFKIIGIFLAKQMDPYKAKFYAWIDFGGSHVLREFNEYAHKMIQNPNPKFSICYIHYRNEHDHKFGAVCGVGATAFTVESEYVNQVYCGTLGIFYEMLSYKMGHADEQVFTCFYQRYPELCTIFYEAIHKGRRDIAHAAISKILESIIVGAITISDEEIAWLRSELIRVDQS